MSEAPKVLDEYDNSRPFDVHKWSDYPEVNNAVNHIYTEIVSLGKIERKNSAKIKKYAKVLALDLYVAYLSDPTLYIGISRNHNSYKHNRYNAIFIKPDLLAKVCDWFIALGYIKYEKGVHHKRQSRIRASEKFVDLLSRKFDVKALMVKQHENTETVILRDANKKRIDYADTVNTKKMRENLFKINSILDKTLINLYVPDSDLRRLNFRMINGTDESDKGHEEPRGAVDFTRKRLVRIFNTTFELGGRFYGGHWQGIPREYRKYIKINRMITKEVDFTAIHINLIYFLANLPLPEEDPYFLDGFPDGTRSVVKKCLLTIINAKNRKSAMQSIREHIRGIKYTTTIVNGKKITKSKKLKDKDRIVLPQGVTRVEDVIEAFENKHSAISKDYFFSGKGTLLQYYDSRIAEEVMLIMEQKGIPVLPLHDSFIVSSPQEKGLMDVMSQAFFNITGRYPKYDSKMSLIDINILKEPEQLQKEYAFKMKDMNYTEEFKKDYHTYYQSFVQWVEITGKDNIFFYSKRFNKETY
jgi:hypothetical protein